MSRLDPRTWALRLLLLLAYWLVATAAVDVFMQKNALFEGHQNREYAFETMIDRTAWRPFVYRAMVPWLVNRIDAALPESVQARYQGAAAVVVERYARPDRNTWRTPELERKYLLTFLLMSAFSIAALWALRALIAAEFPDQPALRDAGPLFFGVLLPLSFMNGGFLYDFSELALLFALFAFAWRRWWTATLITLALAVFNKETAALMVVPIAAALYSRLPRAEWLRVTGSMFAVGFAGVMALRIVYGDHPGSTMYDHIQENFEFWTQPGAWTASMTVFTPLLPAPRGLNPLLVLPLLVLLATGWGVRDIALRRLLATSAMINLPLFFLFCWRDETRNLSLLYPAICLNACAAAAARYGTHRSTRMDFR